MATNQKTWREAIDLVLQESSSPHMHYTQIAEEIRVRRLRQLHPSGPSIVSSIINSSLRYQGDDSPYLRVEPGIYALRASLPRTLHSVEEQDAEVEEENPMSFVGSHGIYWDRAQVDWSENRPQLLGVAPGEGIEVDFYSQLGVYILYDLHHPVYVGRSTDHSVGEQLLVHTVDRLRGRWNRFSWFGIRGVTEQGKLESPPSSADPTAVISTLEAILIEVLAPTQNGRGGDHLSAGEFLQVEAKLLRRKGLTRQFAGLLPYS